MYNCKSLMYADGSIETRFYSDMIFTGKKRKKVKPAIFDYNPFENAYMLMDLIESKEDGWSEEVLEERRKRSESVSKRRTIQCIYAYARANKWQWFVTLTFNPEKVNRFDYSACQKKLSRWLENLRRDNPNMKYLFVPEMHLGEHSAVDEHGNHAWHFHGLVNGLENANMQFSGHWTDSKDPEPIYNIGRYKYGWSTATEVYTQEGACKYLTKYITKDLCEVTKGRKRYWASRNLDKPQEWTMILDAEEKRECIEGLSRNCVSMKELISVVGFKERKTLYICNRERNPELINN